MKKRITYSLSVLALLLSFNACSGGGTATNYQSPDIATSASNTIPVAVVELSEHNTSIGKLVKLDARNSYDNDGDTLTYEWKDAQTGRLLSTDPTIERLFTSEGTYNMTLFVIDSKGGINSDDVSIKVTRHANNTATNDTPPVAKATATANSTTYTTDSDDATGDPDTITFHTNSGDKVHFSDNGSYDPDGGNIVSYRWVDMDGIVLSDTKSFDRNLYYRPEYDPGDGTNVYRKTLYVTDDDGLVSSVTFEIIVHKLDSNLPPVVDLGPDKHIFAGQNTTLHAAATDADGVIDYYIWKKNGVVVAEGPYLPNFTTDNLAAGTHTYTVTVRDNDGAEATDSIDIIVDVSGASGG